MHTIKYLLFFALIIMLGSCIKSAEIVDLDILPTPEILILGADEIMQIPGPNTTGKYTFDTEKKKVYIHLGIFRSGVAKNEGFNVKLSLDKESVSNLILASNASNYLHMPEDMIQIPREVEVMMGKEGEGFTVEIDLSKASEYIGKILVAAIRISDPSKYELSERFDTKLIYFDYMQFLGSPTFVDEFDSETFTRKYANIVGDVRFEMGSNIYNDASRVMRLTDKGAEVVYDVNKIKNLLPFASAFTGVRINVLASPNENLKKLIRFAYSVDNGQTFNELKDPIIDSVFIPELGLGSWGIFYIQGPLPTSENTSHFKVIFQDQTGTGTPPWVPILSRLEIFYAGGKNYEYQKF